MARRSLGDAVGGIPDAAKIHMMETLRNVVEMSTLPPAAWAEMMLVYAINEAHDRNFTREHVQEALQGILDEEYSTPNTTGRLRGRQN